MIHVRKRGKAPATLARGRVLTQTDCDSFDADPVSYSDGRSKFDFRKEVYGAPSVKRAIATDQHDKCCFCEGRFDAHVAGDVEHFRPKGAVGQGKTKLYPGYFWLAYSWSNLYFSCPDCNQYRKRDQFPLLDEGARSRSHQQDVSGETPLLLDPAGHVNPRDHIRFDDDEPIGLTLEGRTTIAVLKLGRDSLNRRRREILAHVKGLRRVVELLGTDTRADAVTAVAEAEAFLRRAVEPQAEFSAVVRDCLADWHRP